MESYSVTIQMKATEQYSPVVLFIMLYKVVLTFEFVDEILKCDHSDESYWVVLSRGAESMDPCWKRRGGGAPFGLNRDFPLDTVTVFRVFRLLQGMPVRAHYMYLFEIL